MNKKIVSLMLCLLFFIATSSGAGVQYTGTLNVVFVDISSVMIDQQRYQLSPEATIFTQSNPDGYLFLSSSMEGYQVLFSLREFEHREPMITQMMLLDE